MADDVNNGLVVLPIDKFVGSIPVSVSTVLSPANAICTDNSSMFIPVTHNNNC